jgi:hypothetical protein
LEQYNELLRICELHSDLASVHKVGWAGAALNFSNSLGSIRQKLVALMLLQSL